MSGHAARFSTILRLSFPIPRTIRAPLRTTRPFIHNDVACVNADMNKRTTIRPVNSHPTSSRHIWTAFQIVPLLLIALLGTLWSDQISPDETLPLEGTTFEEQAELGGVVLRDETFPFEVKDEEGVIILSGLLQDRVVRSTDLQTLIFGPTLRDLELGNAREARITGVAMEGLGREWIDANYRLDALGEAGPHSVSRGEDGDALLFNYESPNLDPSQRAYPLSVLTEATGFKLTGRVSISVEDHNTGQTFHTVVEGTAAPRLPQNGPGPGEPPAITLQQEDGITMLVWSKEGVLEFSDDLNNWEPLPEAESPYVLEVDRERPRYARINYWPSIEEIDFEALNQDNVDLVEPELRPRWVPSKKPIHLEPTRNIAGVFIIKFVEGSHIRLTTGGLYLDEEAIAGDPEEMRRLNRALIPTVSEAKKQMADIEVLIQDYGVSHGFEMDYIFRPPGYRFDSTAAGADQEFIEKRKLEKLVSEELADLDLYYVLHAKNFSDQTIQKDFMTLLQAFPIVEQVYGAALTAGADKDKTTPNISSQQGYLDPAPKGIDARYAWTKPGGKGTGSRLIDVEYDWVTDHEDFPPSSQKFFGRRPFCPYVKEGSEHGTAVMGVLAAPHNQIGVDGIVPNLSYGFSTTCRPIEYVWAAHVATFLHDIGVDHWAGRCHNLVVAVAINEAYINSKPGDTILIEQHTWAPTDGRTCKSTNCDQFGMIAMEFYPECFDAIRRATAKGIIVVEAAGNGEQDLDLPGFEKRFDPSVRHSGAILVGASGAGNRTPTGWSCTSKRIDLFAWGEWVVTTGYQKGKGVPFTNTEIPCYYTNDFGGTSSASAIVSGAVASLQGMRLGVNKLLLLPKAMRNTLHSTGTPQIATSINRPIGKQPNLKAAAQKAVGVKPKFLGAGDYTIRNKKSGKVLDIDLGFLHLQGGDNGRKLQQWSHRGSNNQEFRVFSAGQGVHEIVPLHTAKVLEIANGSLAAGAQAQQGEFVKGARHQMFRIEAVGDYYRIISIKSKMALQVRDGSFLNGATIEQAPISKSDEQLFRFIRLR